MDRGASGRLRRGLRAAALVAGLALAGAPGGAAAVSLTNVVATDLSAVTNAGIEAPDYDVSTALAEVMACGASCGSFQTRFSGAALVEADEDLESGVVDFDWSYRITFDVDAAATQAWELAVGTRLLGALTLVDDSAGDAAATLGDFGGSYTGPGSTSGSLDVTGLGALAAPDGGNAGVDAGESASSFAVTGGVGPATLSFDFGATGSVESSCGNIFVCWFGGTRGDEAAVRLGETGTAPFDLDGGSFGANAYPGVDARSLAGDGHFAQFTVTAVPEPETALLVGLGVLGLGLRPETRRR